jgi:transcriptional regulator of acetoin/glycerol metabolism
MAHDWPGNVRELRNAIERAKLLASNRVVSATDLNLPPPPRPAVHEGDPFTREIIEASLRKARGNISRAAQSLGLSRQAFYRRMERCGLKT